MNFLNTTRSSYVLDASIAILSSLEKMNIEVEEE
jgi:hypothetical protein